VAPELLRHEATNSAATDVYSFGITLYEVFSRRDPYENEDPREVLSLVCNKEVNKRPPAPRGMPEQISSRMTDDVDEDPANRPPFVEIDNRLKRVDVKNANPGKFQSPLKTSSLSLFDTFPRHIAEALRDDRTMEPDFFWYVVCRSCCILTQGTTQAKLAHSIDPLLSLPFSLLHPVSHTVILLDLPPFPRTWSPAKLLLRWIACTQDLTNCHGSSVYSK